MLLAVALYCWQAGRQARPSSLWTGSSPLWQKAQKCVLRFVFENSSRHVPRPKRAKDHTPERRTVAVASERAPMIGPWPGRLRWYIIHDPLSLCTQSNRSAVVDGLIIALLPKQRTFRCGSYTHMPSLRRRFAVGFCLRDPTTTTRDRDRSASELAIVSVWRRRPVGTW
jgi:hypothetical protein